jgi:RNA polymerase sigma-70 factor (ECF subfamily)
LNAPVEAQTPLSPEEEDALIRKAQAGSESAFEALVKAYMRRSYFVALELVRNHEDALDCSQEAFVKAYRALGRFKLGSPFFPWLYRITRNHTLNFLKKERRGRNLSLDQMKEDYGMDFPAGSPGPRATAAEKERNELLWAAIDRLKPDFREIIVLRHFHNMPYEDLAAALDIPTGTVMSRLFNARKALKTALERSKFADEALGGEDDG